MGKIQFKRVNQYEGSFAEASTHIQSLNLQPGEPFLCSYKEDEETRYFLAIGTLYHGIPGVKIFPGFSDFDDFSEFVKKRAHVEPQAIFREISAESQIVLDTELGTDGKPKIIIPDLM